MKIAGESKFGYLYTVIIKHQIALQYDPKLQEPENTD